MEIKVGKTAGFCYGVKRAVESSKKDLVSNKHPIYCLGELVHNQQVIEELQKAGLKQIENIQEAKGKTILRAHGVTKEVYKIAEENKIEIMDYTCPNVLKIHDIAKEYQSKDYFILLTGSKSHPENMGTISYCGKNYFVIEKREEIREAIESLKRSGKKEILLISQTTFSCEKFQQIEEEIKKRLDPEFKIFCKNTICRATEIRQKETETLAKEVEAMIIIGGKNSSNTKKLYEIARNLL